MSLIKKKGQIELPKSIVGCITGMPGLGKTTLALSAPKPLLLDTDNGVHRVQAEYRVDTVQVENYQQILDVLNDEDLSDYETIVIDTLGELVNYMIVYFVKKNPSLVLASGTYNVKIWQLIKQEFQRLKMKLQELKKNLIFVSHVSEDKDGDDKVYRMDVAGSSSAAAIKISDFVGFCEIVGKNRSISFSPSKRFYAKNSIGLDDYIEIPILKTGDTNDFLTREIIIPTIERRKQESVENQKNEEQLQQGRELIEQGTDPNAVMTTFKEMSLSKYNKVKLFNELQEKFKDTYNFDTKKKEFVEVENG